MIEKGKTANSLFALNGILVLLRKWAYDGESPEKIAKVLDDAEMLPRLIAEPEDRTVDFEKYLAAIARRYPQFSMVLTRFRDPVPDKW